jgi:hypothetical protein
MDKLWIDLEGKLIAFSESHEESANQHGHELESLLDHGWVRIQNVPPHYLLIDFKVRLNAKQAVAVGQLFENQFDQVVIEHGEEAMRYAVGVE